MTAVASMAQTFTKAQEFLTILRNESSMFSKKGKRRKLWDEIMQYDFKNESKITNNEKMMVVYRFIQNHFNKSIYENLTKPNPNTGKLLMDKVYWMIWTPARRAAVKEANKHAHEAAKAAKQAELKKQKKEAAKKRADKEKMEIFRLGKGDEALGTKRYQERMRKDGNAKAEKEAAEVSQDAKKLLEFWTWRLGEGKYYDKKMQAADIERPGQYAYAHKSKTISLKPECIMKTLTYLLEKKVATKPCITFKDDSQGTVHYSTLVHLPTNDSRHITTMPVRPLNFVKHRQTPAEISGPITGFRMCEGKFYFRVNNMSMPNTHMLLPKKWEKFNKAAAKWIGSKKYEACPNHRVNVPLLLNLRDPKGIKSISWVESETKYTAVVQTYGKDLAYIKSLRGKSQAEKEADALKEMQAAAAQQKEQRRIESIARQFAKSSRNATNSASATTILEAFKQVKQQTATKPKFCSSCGAKINNLTLSGSKAKFCGECGTRFV